MIIYQIIFYVPASQLQAVKAAMFAAGAGSVGNYQQCAWQVLGSGQFCPQEGSRPFIGSQHQLESVVEYKVEMVCEHAYIKPALQALIQSHPYETPAYSVFEMKTLDDF